ncbi:hypothetical protein NOL25_14510 [Vibrio parahaemolyticus]|nr:hypothetical protein [Vibrio parahaemolyticus]EKH9203259.1 hypothetical protein [Vibrio parahaemolyticus]MCX8803193.1 hypothetical protein [Vibrio parahaemolyticus]MCX8828154.1 hypothetical protein [Vibrio parahaemolyticus]MCX8929101.1 hypothetical protein [Vibrio parahaemolyticus]MDF5668052.1 hypothetical protein [Vibrio parahaemolyticus]
MRRNGKPFTLVLEVMFDRHPKWLQEGGRVRYSEPNCRWPDSIWRAERSEKQTNDDSYLEKRRKPIFVIPYTPPQQFNDKNSLMMFYRELEQAGYNPEYSPVFGF